MQVGDLLAVLAPKCNVGDHGTSSLPGQVVVNNDLSPRVPEMHSQGV